MGYTAPAKNSMPHATCLTVVGISYLTENQSKVWFQIWNLCVRIKYRRKVATKRQRETARPKLIRARKHRQLFAHFHIEYASGIPPHTDMPRRVPTMCPREFQLARMQKYVTQGES
jgi:hypothetical protein